jgi:hypothetical protein
LCTSSRFDPPERARLTYAAVAGCRPPSCAVAAAPEARRWVRREPVVVLVLFPWDLEHPSSITVVRRRSPLRTTACRQPVDATRAHTAPELPDPQPTTQIRPDPGQSARTSQPPPGRHPFAKEPSCFFRFTSRSARLRVFLADRSRFLRFSPENLGFFSV